MFLCIFFAFSHLSLILCMFLDKIPADSLNLIYYNFNHRHFPTNSSLIRRKSHCCCSRRKKFHVSVIKTEKKFSSTGIAAGLFGREMNKWILKLHFFFSKMCAKLISFHRELFEIHHAKNKIRELFSIIIM